MSARVSSLALLVLAVSVGATGAEPAVRIQWKDSLLTVGAESAQLADVLEVVARETGIEIFGGEHLEETSVSTDFSGLTLREGLARILSGQSYVLIEETSGRGVRPVAVALGRWRRDPLHNVVRAIEPATDETAPIVESLADRDPTIRAWAVSRLSGQRDAETLARLINGLRDTDAHVREAALDALAPFGPAAIDAVAALVRRETVPEVRSAATRLLGQIAKHDAAPVLRSMLADPDPQVRVAAVEAAGHADDRIGQDMLIAALRDSDPAVRMTALRTLAFYRRNDDARAAVRQALADPDETVRAVATGLLEVTRD